MCQWVRNLRKTETETGIKYSVVFACLFEVVGVLGGMQMLFWGKLLGILKIAGRTPGTHTLHRSQLDVTAQALYWRAVNI